MYDMHIVWISHHHHAPSQTKSPVYGPSPPPGPPCSGAIDKLVSFSTLMSDETTG